MKILDRIAFIIFSDIVLVISVVACVVIFKWIDYNVISDLCYKAITTELPSQIILGISIVLILLALKCIFFSATEKQEKFKQGILLENEKGKLMISQETLQSIVNSVARSFEGTDEVNTSVGLDKEKNLIIYINLTVKPNATIKDLSTDIQSKVKETIKQSTDLDVKEVNIKIKNIASKIKQAKS